MKTKIIVLFIALLPILAFAEGPGKNKRKVDLHLTVDKKGKVEASGLPNDLKDLEDDLNKALKEVTVKTDDGKTHDLHIRIELTTK